jgi:hypothetical protein
MARITWLGDVECMWNNVVFPPGKPVEIDDAHMIGKAKTNRFFRLDEGVPRPQGTVYGPAPEMWTNSPDYPPEDEQPPRRKRGRPPRIRDNGDDN